MSRCTVYLLEAGLPASLPGIPSGYPALSFPFFRNYCFLDFALANFNVLDPPDYYIKMESRFRGLISFLTSHGEHDASRLVVLEEHTDEQENQEALQQSLRQLIRHIRNHAGEAVIIATVSAVCLIKREGLLALMKQGTDLVKLSIAGVPLDIFLARKKPLLEVLESFLPRNPSGNNFFEYLFEGILHTSFDLIEDIPGSILFHNNLMQFYKENLGILSNTRLTAVLSHLKGIKVSDKQALVKGSGHIKDSFVAAGACIEGYVEGSLIFRDCVVRKGARVINSVIMDRNRIGTNSNLVNCLVFPSQGDSTRGLNNIGDGVTIGKKRSLAANDDYPKQIREGLTVLGLNAEIPKGYTIEAGCYVAANVPFQKLRELKIIKKGATVRWNSIR